jgi:hypothetical protein
MPETQEISLKSTGDKELWVVRGDTWELPIFAAPIQDSSGGKFYLTEHAMKNMGSWFDLLEAKILPLTIDCNGQWILPETVLNSIAFKAPGITPSYYVKVEGLQIFKPDPTLIRYDHIADEEGDNFQGFADFVARESQLHTSGDIKMFLAELRDCAVKWLLDKRRPLDLGFAKILAVPFRSNWKQYWDFWYPPAIFKQPLAEREQYLKQYSVDQKMHDPVLLEMHGDGGLRAIGWNLEIVPSTEWKKRVEFRESRAIKAEGVGYLERIKSITEKLREHIVFVYTDWVKRKSLPTGEISPGSVVGRHPLRASASVSRRNPDGLEGGAFRIGKRRLARGKMLTNHGEQADSEVPELSTVQPITGNVWYSGRDVAHGNWRF